MKLFFVVAAACALSAAAAFSAGTKATGSAARGPRLSMPPPSVAVAGGAAAQVSDDIKTLLGSEFRDAKGNKVDVSRLAGKKLIAVYFSAHWCPPCRAFTPVLVQAAKKWLQNKDPIEVVFVSRDHGEKEMDEYMRVMDMPWIALPFQSAQGQKISKDYKVSGIPALLVFDANGKLIDGNARGTVTQQGEAALKKWLP